MIRNPFTIPSSFTPPVRSRFLPRLLVLGLAAAGLLVLGRPAPVHAQQETVEDTLDWRGYYPLQVGNVWEYHFEGERFPYQRRVITGDTVIDGRSYYIHRTTRYDRDRLLAEGPIVDYLRYDTTRHAVVAHMESDTFHPEWSYSDSLEQPWAGPKPVYVGPVTCDLSVDFGQRFFCQDSSQTNRALGGYIQRSYGEIEVRAQKEIYEEGRGISIFLYHGVGQVLSFSLTYLNIGGKIWGRSAVNPQIVKQDTLDWRGYYPLQVDNVWEYYRGGTSYEGWIPGCNLQRRAITGDTLIDGTRYYVHRTSLYASDTTLVRPPIVDYLRYDTTRRAVVAHAAGDSYPAWNLPDTTEQPWMGPIPQERYPEPLSCNLAADFGERIHCSPADSARPIVVYGGYTNKIEESLHVPARKEFGIAQTGTSIVFDYGIGEIAGKIKYLKVGDHENGRSMLYTSIDDEPRQITAFELSVYPNPFNNQTTIRLDVDRPGRYAVELFNLTGRKIRTVTEAKLAAGRHRYRLDLSGLSTGLYFVIVRSGQEMRVQKINYLK